MPRPIVVCRSCGEEYELLPSQKVGQPNLECNDCQRAALPPTIAPAPVKVAKPSRPKSLAAHNRGLQRATLNLLRAVEELKGGPDTELRVLVAPLLLSTLTPRQLRVLREYAAGKQ